MQNSTLSHFQTNFNSKTVQLKVAGGVSKVASKAFQFQNGSIKSQPGFEYVGLLTPFQFQNGSIKRSIREGQSISYLDFNSKTVQLKAEGTVDHPKKTKISIPKRFN